MANLTLDGFFGPVIVVDGVGYMFNGTTYEVANVDPPPDAVFADADDFYHPCEVLDLYFSGCAGSFMQAKFNVRLSDYNNDIALAEDAVDALITEWLENGGDPDDPVCVNPIECGRVHDTWAGFALGYVCYTCPESSVESLSSESASLGALYTLCPPIISSSAESLSSSSGPGAWTGSAAGAPWLQLRQAVAGLATEPETFTLSWSIMKEGNTARYYTCAGYGDDLECTQLRKEEREVLELRDHLPRDPGAEAVTSEQFEAEINSAMELWKDMLESVFSVAGGYDNQLTVEIVQKGTETGITTPRDGWDYQLDTVIKGGDRDGEVVKYDRKFTYSLRVADKDWEPTGYHGLGDTRYLLNPHPNDISGTFLDYKIAPTGGPGGGVPIKAYNEGVGDIRIAGISMHRREAAHGGTVQMPGSTGVKAATSAPANFPNWPHEIQFAEGFPGGDRVGYPYHPTAPGITGDSGGDIMFDVLGMNWRRDGFQKDTIVSYDEFPGGRHFWATNIRLIALHELGHSLGIGHDTDITSIMAGGHGETLVDDEWMPTFAALDMEGFFPAASGGFIGSAPDRRSLQEIYGFPPE